jgi:hypothetical protein
VAAAVGLLREPLRSGDSCSRASWSAARTWGSTSLNRGNAFVEQLAHPMPAVRGHRFEALDGSERLRDDRAHEGAAAREVAVGSGPGTRAGAATSGTGHETRSMFNRYHIVSPGDLQEAARRIDAAQGPIFGRVAPSRYTPHR